MCEEKRAGMNFPAAGGRQAGAVVLIFFFMVLRERREESTPAQKGQQPRRGRRAQAPVPSAVNAGVYTVVRGR